MVADEIRCTMLHFFKNVVSVCFFFLCLHLIDYWGSRRKTVSNQWIVFSVMVRTETNTISPVINNTGNILTQVAFLEAEYEMEISVQKVYYGVLLGLTSLVCKGRK